MVTAETKTSSVTALSFALIVLSSLAFCDFALFPGNGEGNAAEPAPNKPVKNAAAGAALATWTAEEVAAAEAQCSRLAHLTGLNYTRLPAIRQGHCGDPAPVNLIAVGSRNLPLMPTVVANCRTTEGVHTWVDTVVQPAARTLLGQDVARLVGVSARILQSSGPPAATAAVPPYRAGLQSMRSIEHPARATEPLRVSAHPGDGR